MSASNEVIPRRIVQIWAGGKEMPLLYKAAVANVRLLNPDFEYVLFDDERMMSFMRERCPQHIATFNAYSLPIQRYDFFRYLAIYELGGFYFDTDLLLAQGISDLCRHACVVPFERLTWSDHLRNELGMDWEVGNYAFGAQPRHSFIGALIDYCARAQRDPAWGELPIRSCPSTLRRELQVIYSTGPGMMSRALGLYRQSAGREPVHVLRSGPIADRAHWNRFGNYGVHLGGSSWRTRLTGLERRLLNFHASRNEARAIALAERSPNASVLLDITPGTSATQ